MIKPNMMIFEKWFDSNVMSLFRIQNFLNILQFSCYGYQIPQMSQKFIRPYGKQLIQYDFMLPS